MTSQVSATLSSIAWTSTGHALENVGKHGSSSPLGQFHSKFWGTSMAVEEEKWRSMQTPVESDGDQMDVDDQINPGCYMLNIGIQGFPLQNIWIRTEFIRVFDYVQQYYDKPPTHNYVPNIIITGQPGIGKTIWVLYALRRCLSERKPVILYRGNTCHLFLEEGVYVLPDRFDLKGIVWTFIDSDEAPNGVPQFLASSGTRHYNIYSTSPKRERWSRLHKTTRINVVVMNPWTVEELIQVATPLFPDRKFTDENIRAIYDQFAPTPRVCLDYQGNHQKLELYKSDVNAAIEQIDVPTIKNLFMNTGVLAMDSISHKICLVRRAKEDDMQSLAVVSIISSAIHSRLAIKFRDLQLDEMIRLYHHFAANPESRSLAGVIYEAFAQCQIRNGCVISIVPMIKLEKGSAQYHSSHLEQKNLDLERLRKEALKRMCNVDIKPVGLEEFPVGGPPSIQKGIYYFPAASNHEASDSFILLNNILYIFQYTIGLTYGIKIGLLTFFEKYIERGEVPPISGWRFVFIIDSNQTLTCPQPWQLKLREMPLYSAVVEVPIHPSQAR